MIDEISKIFDKDDFNLSIIMKKAKNIFWLLSIFLLTFYSCSNDTEDSSKLLMKVVKTQDNGISETILFSYNDSKIVNMDGTTSRTDFTYTDGLITKTVLLNKSNQLRETIDYKYLDGKLIEVTSSENYKIKYIHNVDRTVSYNKFSFDSANQETKIYHGTLFFDNGNLTKDDRIFDNTAVGVISNEIRSFDYDGKKNPFNDITGYNRLLVQSQVVSSNNIVLIVEEFRVTKGDQITSSASRNKCIYKYDAAGYPTEQNAEVSGANSGSIKSEYFY